jgi:hypothetical protein
MPKAAAEKKAPAKPAKGSKKAPAKEKKVCRMGVLIFQHG